MSTLPRTTTGETDRRAVTQIMRPVTTVEKEGHLAAVAYLMEKADTQAIVVMTDEDQNRPVAIVTTTDVVRAVAHGVDAGEARLHDWMQRPTSAIAPDTPIDVAACMLLDGGCDFLPVVAEDRVVGIVSTRDILQADYPATGRTLSSAQADTVLSAGAVRAGAQRTTPRPATPPPAPPKPPHKA